MQHLEGSGTPVLYIGRTVLNPFKRRVKSHLPSADIIRSSLYSPYFIFIQWRYSPTGLWPTERPPPVSEASANFCGYRGVAWSAQRFPTAVNLCLSNLDRYLFLFK